MKAFPDKLVASGRERAMMDKDIEATMREQDTPEQLRHMAETFDRWAVQLRFKADVQEGRLPEHARS